MRELSQRSKIILSVALIISVILVGIADFATGSEFAFSVFYLFPVAIAAWFGNRVLAITISVLSALSWYLADILARPEPYSQSLIPAWNSGVRVLTFLLVAVLLGILREVLKRESLIARIDYLTGAANSRGFYEAAEVEIARLRRYGRPFTVLYLDADNLKRLNDTLGHSAGDKILQATVSILKRALRPGDTVARLGGDEFAILLPEVDDHGSEVVSNRVQAVLRQALEAKDHITYSIGSLTCTVPPRSVDELIERADNLMYEAKRGGKDKVARSTFIGAA
jgi:diguanylate cyclase (GGDEF)-like protein